MARLSMNELTTYRWSFEEDVQQYQAAGIEAMGVWRQKLSDFGEEKGIELLAESGIRVSNLLWAGGFTGSDGRSFKDSVADAKDALRVGGALRAECLVVYTGNRAGHTHNHARRLLKAALTELTPLAEEFGVTLCLEPMHPGCAGEWTFLTDLDETLELLDQFDNSRVKMVFDSYHLGGSPEVVERLEQLAPRVGVVHLGDAKQPPEGEQNRCPLGHGDLPLPQMIAQLTKGGFEGYFDIELMGENVETWDYGELIAQSKQTFAELVNAAQPR